MGGGGGNGVFLNWKAVPFVEQICCPLCKQLHFLLAVSDICAESLLWRSLKGTPLMSPGINGAGEAQPLVTQALVSCCWSYLVQCAAISGVWQDSLITSNCVLSPVDPWKFNLPLLQGLRQLPIITHSIFAAKDRYIYTLSESVLPSYVSSGLLFSLWELILNCPPSYPHPMGILLIGHPVIQFPWYVNLTQLGQSTPYPGSGDWSRVGT